MKTLNFFLDPQECSEWCWAAVTSAIGRFYQDTNCPTTQCGVVNRILALGGRDCCAECECKTDPFEPCNQPRNLGVALGTFRLGRDGPNGITALQFSEIKSEIDDDRPIAISIRLDDPAASKHAVVIFGYTDQGGVFIADPLHADTIVTASYDALLAGTDADVHGQWQAAFRTKRANE